MTNERGKKDQYNVTYLIRRAFNLNESSGNPEQVNFSYICFALDANEMYRTDKEGFLKKYYQLLDPVIEAVDGLTNQVVSSLLYGRVSYQDFNKAAPNYKELRSTLFEIFGPKRINNYFQAIVAELKARWFSNWTPEKHYKKLYMNPAFQMLNSGERLYNIFAHVLSPEALGYLTLDNWSIDELRKTNPIDLFHYVDKSIKTYEGDLLKINQKIKDLETTVIDDHDYLHFGILLKKNDRISDEYIKSHVDDGIIAAKKDINSNVQNLHESQEQKIKELWTALQHNTSVDSETVRKLTELRTSYDAQLQSLYQQYEKLKVDLNISNNEKIKEWNHILYDEFENVRKKHEQLKQQITYLEEQIKNNRDVKSLRNDIARVEKLAKNPKEILINGQNVSAERLGWCLDCAGSTRGFFEGEDDTLYITLRNGSNKTDLVLWSPSYDEMVSLSVEDLLELYYQSRYLTVHLDAILQDENIKFYWTSNMQGLRITKPKYVPWDCITGKKITFSPPYRKDIKTTKLTFFNDEDGHYEKIENKEILHIDTEKNRITITFPDEFIDDKHNDFFIEFDDEH